MIVVEKDRFGNVVLRHSRWAVTEPGRCTFTMLPGEWEDLLWRAACYALETRKLPLGPETIPLEDILDNRFMLTGTR